MMILLGPKNGDAKRVLMHSLLDAAPDEESLEQSFWEPDRPVLCSKEFADEYSLMHYRTRGSRNGVRRYQNKDGSYTALGYQHYSDMYGWGNAPQDYSPALPLSPRQMSRPAVKMQAGNYQRQPQTLQSRTANKLSGPVSPQFRSGIQSPNRQPVSNAGSLNHPVLVRSNSNQPGVANNPDRQVLLRNNQNQPVGQHTSNKNRPVLVRNNSNQSADQHNGFAWSAKRVEAAGGLESREGRQIIYGNPTLNEDYKKQIAKRYGDSDGKSYPKSLDEKAGGNAGKSNRSGQQASAHRAESDSEGGKDTTGQFGRGNIDLNKRKVVRNADGSISTERSFSINIDGKETLLPTVIDGRIVSEEEAIDHYLKTGEHLGQFDTVEEAEAYAEELHNRQDWYYNQREKDRNGKTKSAKVARQ